MTNYFGGAAGWVKPGRDGERKSWMPAYAGMTGGGGYGEGCGDDKGFGRDGVDGLSGRDGRVGQE